jgi:Tfp pilus assembly protein PilF
MISDTASSWAGVRRFEDILKRDPQAYSFAPLADLYRSLGLLDDALQAARKGCAIHPDFAAGQMALARAALESSLKTEAKSALEAVVRITPENLEAQRLLADIYAADNEQAAAQRCLVIVSSLEAGAVTVPATHLASAAEELGEDDIMELTDDLIDTDVIGNAAVSPFAATPERPSLGDVPQRAEPFLMETAPPFYQQEQAEMPSAPIAENESVSLAEEEEPAAPVASATIAELYVSQGFPDKGAEVYRTLLQVEPGNDAWRRRLAELSAPVAVSAGQEAQATAAATGAETGTTEGVLEALCGWLANIGRVRSCRTKIT